MMTVTQTERLVRKIAEAVGQTLSDTQTSKLAQDYAEICRMANRRLEQCAIMIEAGQFLQALQLAETPPPLLDLITLLSFRQAAEWRAYCQAHQLPWPEPFYDKYIRLLNNAYGKGIASDHPFYRDYRRAVMENDDARALSILRVISRLNPSDPNTEEELKRLEEKLLRVRLDGLRQVLATGDEAAIQAALEQLEATGLPVPASHPAWQQAQIARCEKMIRRAEELRQQGLWQDVEAMVEDIHAVATRYNLRLPEAEADLWTALEEWTGQQRGAFIAEQDFKRAVAALEYEVQSIAAKRNSGTRLTSGAATAAWDTLDARWREARRFGRPFLEDSLGQSRWEDLAGQYQESDNWLRQQMKADTRRKAIVGIATGAVIVVAILVAIPHFLNLTRQRDVSQRVQRMESARNVSGVEDLLSKVPISWKANPQMAQTLAKADDFAALEKQLKQNFDQKLAGLQKIAADGFASAYPQVGPDRASCENALNQVATEYQAPARRALDAWDHQWQTFRNSEIAGVLSRAEAIAVGLNATNRVEGVRASMAQIQARLSGLEPLEAQPPALDQGLADRIGSLSNQVEVWAGTTHKWDQAQTTVSNAPSLDEYMAALDQLVASPFSTLAQREAVAGLSRLQISEETLLGQLLLPNNRSAWPSLTNVAGWSASLMPEQPTSQEKDLYFKLRDDKNVRDIYAYELIANPRTNNPYHTHPVFVQGAIALNNGGDEAGMVQDPALYQDSLHFVQTAHSDWNYIKIERLYRTRECDSYERLGLGDLIDANTGNYQKPILQLFDQLNQDDKSSAAFRAYVTFKLLAVAQLRPSEWGLTWCPSATTHIQALTQLGAKDIQSGDWMVPERSDKFEKPLQDYFAQARGISLEKQARFLQQLVRETCEKGFVFAGFIDSSGHPVLHASNSSSAELCGWSKSGTAAVLLRRNSDGSSYTFLAEPWPYTPLFAFSGDRRELLLQTLNATGCPAAVAGPILPPFFAGAL